MLAQYLDITDELLTGQAIVELSNYDYCVLQIAGNTGATYLFEATLDGGAIQSVSDGNYSSSVYYSSVGATNLSTNAFETTNSAADGLWRFGVVGRYLKIVFDGGSPSTLKAIVMLAKIS